MWHVQYYNYNHRDIGGENMANKSVTPSIRMSEAEYSKLKALKEQYGVTWDEFIAYANRVLSEDIKKREL